MEPSYPKDFPEFLKELYPDGYPDQDVREMRRANDVWKISFDFPPIEQYSRPTSYLDDIFRPEPQPKPPSVGELLEAADNQIYDNDLNIDENYDEMIKIAYDLGDQLFLHSVAWPRRDYSIVSPYYELWLYWAELHRIPSDQFAFWWRKIYI